MATHGGVAKLVREHKEDHPELYCAARGCLWRLSSGPCRKHSGGAVRPISDTEAADIAAENDARQSGDWGMR